MQNFIPPPLNLAIESFTASGIVSLTPEDLCTLVKCAANHYDGECRGQEQIFRNFLEIAEDAKFVTLDVTTRRLDLWCKVTELLIPEDNDAIRRLNRSFYICLTGLKLCEGIALENYQSDPL